MNDLWLVVSVVLGFLLMYFIGGLIWLALHNKHYKMFLESMTPEEFFIFNRKPRDEKDRQFHHWNAERIYNDSK